MKNLVAMMVTVVMVAGALVGCGSQEVATTTAQDTAVSETTTENASVEEAAVEATVEESAEAATEEVSVDEAAEEVSVETTEKTAEEQLAEATIIKEYRVYNKCEETDGRYVAYLIEGNRESFKSLSCGDEDGFNDETFNDYKFVFNVVTSDEAESYYKETPYDATFFYFPSVCLEPTVEYNEDLGCFVEVYYTDEAKSDIVSISFIFVEQ